ncbi:MULTISPECIES: hypothetical protein [Dysgonomonadaceae]|uniref:hypothetical protein n=1 Tax=Dysgonomonadaceae TaxID=2005520 RepID=UPI000E8A8FE2|nr:hypothetical protein [Proteiniphilum sp. UBA5259]HBC37842.1 hypothetical protein [Porphyromonadaceae bacterium]
MKRYGKTALQQNRYYEVGNIYEYMVENYINGNFTQFDKLHKELCRDAKRDFITYCFSEVHPQLLQEIILRTI